MIKDVVVLLAILANEMIVCSFVLKQKLMNFSYQHSFVAVL